MFRRAVLFRWLLELDRLANVILGGTYPETLSIRWGREQQRGCRLCAFLCALLDIVDPDHCDTAHRRYEALRQALDKVNEEG